MIRSTIGKKIVLGLTGLLLIGFVVIHLAGNLLIYLGFEYYDHYAHALHASTLLPIAEIGLLVLFLAHIFYAIQISRENRKARPERYAKIQSKQDRICWTPSAIMFISGAIVLGFILLHLADMRFALRLPGPDGESPAARTVRVLQNPVTGIVYFCGSLFLGYHLAHGFQSLFQTFGLNNPKYTPWIKRIGTLLAVLLALGFASFPVWAYLVKSGVLP